MGRKKKEEGTVSSSDKIKVKIEQAKPATREYVKNKDLLAEIIKSKEQDELTPEAVRMLSLIAENVIKKMVYQNPDDRDDCLQGALLDVLMYWRSFDPTKSSNPFAYYTSLITNGIGKTWRKLGKVNFPASIMTRLDCAQIHSL